MNDELEPDDVHRQIEQREPGKGNERSRGHQRHVHHEQIGEAQLEIAEELAAFRNGADDGAKIIVEKHYRGHFTRRTRAALAHGDANIGTLQRRHVVHAIARHGDDLAGGAECAHEIELLRRDGARHDVEIH